MIVDVDEDLGTYWQSLRGHDQKLWYANEVYLRKKLQLRTMDDQAFESDTCLRGAKRTNKFIRGNPNYEILGNARYCQEFQFITLDQRKPEDFETSDMIPRVLYLADHYQVDTINNSKV